MAVTFRPPCSLIGNQSGHEPGLLFTLLLAYRLLPILLYPIAYSLWPSTKGPSANGLNNQESTFDTHAFLIAHRLFFIFPIAYSLSPIACCFINPILK
jgi:hypothetical protein